MGSAGKFCNSWCQSACIYNQNETALFKMTSEVCQKKPLLSKKNNGARSQFVTEHIGKEQGFWNCAEDCLIKERFV